MWFYVRSQRLISCLYVEFHESGYWSSEVMEFSSIDSDPILQQSITPFPLSPRTTSISRAGRLPFQSKAALHHNGQTETDSVAQSGNPAADSSSSGVRRR